MIDKPAFGMPPESAGFDVRGAWVLAHLMTDLGLTDIQAAGIVGNLGGESGLTAIQEVSPIAGRGGFGWAQRTGPRRVAFETWCSANGLNETEDEANYRFLIAELKDQIPNDPQSHVIDQVKKTTTVDAAVETVEAIFERPADLQSGLPSRIQFARRALAAVTDSPSAPAPASPAPAPVQLPPPPSPPAPSPALEAAIAELQQQREVLEAQVVKLDAAIAMLQSMG